MIDNQSGRKKTLIRILSCMRLTLNVYILKETPSVMSLFPIFQVSLGVLRTNESEEKEEGRPRQNSKFDLLNIFYFVTFTLLFSWTVRHNCSFQDPLSGNGGNQDRLAFHLFNNYMT